MAAHVFPAAWLLALALCPAVLAQADPVRVVYLANEGVMLEAAGGRVLIDALFGDGLPEYPVVPRTLRDSLEGAKAGFGGPAVVLTTHAHRDHFDAAALARYRDRNPDAVVLGPPGLPPAPAPAALTLDWVEVRPLAIPHGQTSRPVGHTAYLVTLAGITALHLGDTTSDPDTWPAAGLPAEGVDIALVPYWYALDEEAWESLLRVVGDATVVLLHTLRPGGETDGWEQTSRSLSRRYPRVRTPSVPGETVDIATTEHRGR